MDLNYERDRRFSAGSYPGTILAGFRPVLALKGNVTTRHIGGISLRRGLIRARYIVHIGIGHIAGSGRYRSLRVGKGRAD